MSGRSAYVRKKITQTKDGSNASGDGGEIRPGRGRAKSSTTSSSDDNATVNDYPLPGMVARQDTGVGTTNARFLKFSEPIRENEMLTFRGDIPSYASHSGGSQSDGSVDGRRERDAAAVPHQFKGPLQDFAYARARRPVIKTEDVSGIEKSGFRSALDKKSEEVRKGIAKTFAFRKKDKRTEAEKGGAIEFRPQSSATVRPCGSTGGVGGVFPLADGEFDNEYDSNELSSPQTPYSGPLGGSFEDQLRDADRQFPNLVSPPPAGRLPPIPPSTALPPIKRWIGAGRPVQRWNKLRKDPELWDPNGDVLVFFGYKGQQPKPNPSFRLSSHIIEATESRYLIRLLREGSTEDINNVSLSSLQRHGSHFSGNSANNHGYQNQAAGGGIVGGGGRYPGQISTPSISEDPETDGQISYEMYFPSPPNMTRIDQLRYHITTRNVFALLYHASLVGLSLYQTLSDLHSRLDTYMSGETDNVGAIVQYLGVRGIDDVRNDVETAVSLLAWSESVEVRWEEGWRESFLHCAGMYSRVESGADFKNITPITRALLERACLETQLRVQAAEERLAEFQYSDMWPSAVASSASPSGPVGVSPAKGAADRLQRFFVSYYSRIYGCWPPLPPPPQHDAHGMAVGDPADDMWLTRTVAQTLQKDFSALYDYLVNRDIVWDESEARSGRKWMLVSESGNRAFEADTPDLPMTDMLIEFDNRLRFPHIPHPYPLVPESIPPPVEVPTPSGNGTKEKPSKKNNNNTNNNNNSTSGAGTPPNGRNPAMERRVALAYTEATNILLLGSEFIQSDLIDAYIKFEKADGVCEVDPSTARRGRWVPIYGILQTLASVSVDAPNMRYRDNVPYHLSPRLKGAKMPPWKKSSSSSALSQEASHELSHCWLIPRLWQAAVSSGAESSAAESGGSGSNSPVHLGFSFPHPPTVSAGSTITRSSLAGYHTPGGERSHRSPPGSTVPSLSNYPAFGSSGASVVSDSDAGSSVRTPGSNASASRKWPGRTSSNTKGGARWYEQPGGTGLATIGTVDEVDWQADVDVDADAEAAAREQQHQQHQHQHQHQHQQQLRHGSRERRNTGHWSSSKVQDLHDYALPLPPPPQQQQQQGPGVGSGGFMPLDDMMDNGRSYTTSPSVPGAMRPDGSRNDRLASGQGRSGSGSGADSRGRSPVLPLSLPIRGRGSRADSPASSGIMVIRDFDNLDTLNKRAP